VEEYDTETDIEKSSQEKDERMIVEESASLQPLTQHPKSGDLAFSSAAPSKQKVKMMMEV
jgi:hypothetical protein